MSFFFIILPKYIIGKSASSSPVSTSKRSLVIKNIDVLLLFISDHYFFLISIMEKKNPYQ